MGTRLQFNKAKFNFTSFYNFSPSNMRHIICLTWKFGDKSDLQTLYARNLMLERGLGSALFDLSELSASPTLSDKYLGVCPTESRAELIFSKSRMSENTCRKCNKSRRLTWIENYMFNKRKLFSSNNFNGLNILKISVRFFRILLKTTN